MRIQGISYKTGNYNQLTEVFMKINEKCDSFRNNTYGINKSKLN